jgi:hypothetical protein
MDLIYGSSKKFLLVSVGHVEQNMYIFLPILDDISPQLHFGWITVRTDLHVINLEWYVTSF